MAWLSGWTRRKIKIVENLTLSDYQMKLIIHKSGLGPDTSTDIYLGGHCRDDFADLRFTGPDQTISLSYWIESITGIAPNLVATVWIKIPTLTPTNNIYIYYDNPSATSSISNGTNTFLFFDDFSGDLSKWDVWYFGGGNVSISSDAVIITPPVINATGTGISSKTTPLTNNFIVEYKRKDLTTGIKRNYRGFAFGTGNMVALSGANYIGGLYNGYSTWIHSYNNVGAFLEWTNGVPAGAMIGDAFSTEDNNYHDYKVIYKSDGTIQFYSDAILLAHATDTTFLSDNKKIGFFNGRYNIGDSDSVGCIDLVKIRNYILPGPTFGVSGTEELNITAIDMILNTNTCTGPCQIIAGVTWQNLGSSNVTFTPAVLIDYTNLAYGTDITISAGGTNSATITTPILLVGSHTICPYPN